MKERVAIAAGLAVIAIGCASIIHGIRQDVGITSSPPGARISDNGVQLGATPMVAHLKRGKNHILHIELDGYKPYEIALTRHASGWVWGNLFFGGLVGLIIDAANGAIYNLEPENVVAALGKDTAARITASPGSLVVAVTLHADPTWERVGTLTRE